MILFELNRAIFVTVSPIPKQIRLRTQVQSVLKLE